LVMKSLPVLNWGLLVISWNTCGIFVDLTDKFIQSG